MVFVTAKKDKPLEQAKRLPQHHMRANKARTHKQKNLSGKYEEEEKQQTNKLQPSGYSQTEI